MAFGSDETFISDFRINPTSCDGSNSNGDSQSDTDQDTTSSTIDLVNNINRVRPLIGIFLEYQKLEKIASIHKRLIFHFRIQSKG